MNSRLDSAVDRFIVGVVIEVGVCNDKIVVNLGMSTSRI